MDFTLPELAAQKLMIMIEGKENLLVVDSRSFLEYNDGHVLGSVNIQSSKLIRKRLEQNKLSINDLLKCSQRHYDTVVVYDQNTTDVARLSNEHFLWLVAKKLTEQFNSVFYLKGKSLCCIFLHFFCIFQIIQRPSLDMRFRIGWCSVKFIIPSFILKTESRGRSPPPALLRTARIAHL